MFLVATNITTEMMFARLQQEKVTGELLSLPKDFFSQTASFISTLGAAGNEEDKKKQLENTIKIIFSLKERRKQKLLVYLAYNKQLPNPVPEEEEVLYNEIHQILSRDTAAVKVFRFKITASIPEVLTNEGRKIGPYNEGDLIEVANKSDAEFIVKNRIGETINQ